MIVSASYRTDIPAFYGEWFMRRVEAGFADVRNPYSGKSYHVPLDRDSVDGFVFWTRNAGPFMRPLIALWEGGYRFVVQFTITGYPRALESSVIDPGAAIDQARALAERFGQRAVVWRYDPILCSDLTPPDFHRSRFVELARQLRGATDECCVSWAAIYRKTRRNLDASARRRGFGWRDPADEEKRALLVELTELAGDHGIRLTLCSQPELLTARIPTVQPSIAGPISARCVDSQRLSDLAGFEIAAKTKGNRPGCDCSESRDIGGYDSCPHGCVYCYANSSPTAARKRRKAHDPYASSLLGD